MHKRLKIAILIDQLVPGGVQKDAAYEVSHLNKLGYQAKLIVLMRKGFHPNFLNFFPKIPIQFLSDRFPQLLKNSIKFPIFTFFSTLHLLSPYLAPKFIKRDEFDIIIAHGTTTCLTALSLWKKNRIPYIAIIHDPMEYILKTVYAKTPLRYFFWLLSPILFYLEKQIVKNAKIIAVVSEKHSPFIQKHYQIIPEILLAGTSVLPRLPNKKSTFLMASSRWQSGKNPQLLLELMEALPQNKLLVVGNWTNNDDLILFRKKIAEKNLMKRVIIKTDVLPRQLTKLYSRALLWIHPNVEAFGLGGLEAASCGTPVIIPSKSGLTQILKDKQDGFFPKKATLEQFLRPLKVLIKNPQKAYEMGKHAWQTVKKGHSWENHTKQLEGLIKTAFFKIEVVALETGHAQGTVISGGDRLLEEMSPYLSANVSLTVIVPEIAAWHWRNKNARIITLKRRFLDNNPNPFVVFANYIFRSLESTMMILKLPSKDIIYSSTNVFPDVIPGFFAKLIDKNIRWFTRVHHLSLPPYKRPGNLLVNAGSYLLQQISIFALKKKADLVAALNPNLAKILSENGFPKDKLLVVTAGINTKKWQASQSQNLSSKLFDAVFLGRMHPSKGIFDLVPIWGRVCQELPQAKLAIIGQTTPSIVERLKGDAQKAKIDTNIKILGPLASELVKEHLRKSKIFLFTDHEAGFGLAGLEAMTLGLPVIGYDIGILGNVFKKGFIRVKAFNTDRFAQAVVSLLSDQRRLQNLRKEAKNEAKKHDLRKISQDFEKLIISLNLK